MVPVRWIYFKGTNKGNDNLLEWATAHVFDEAGKLLQSVKITSLSQQFNFSNYTNGIYFIKLANKEVMRVMKH